VNIAWWLERAADEHSDRTALVDGRSGESWTYRALRDHSEAVASVLAEECAVGPDDVVVTLMANDRLGAVFSGFNRTLGYAKFATDVSRLQAKVLVVGAEFVDIGRRLLDETTLKHLVVCSPGGHRDLPDLRRLAQERTVPVPVAPRLPSDAAAINFTGGTAGVSKGVIFPHGELTLSAQGSLVFDRLTSSDINLSCISLYHSGGIHDAVKWTLAGAANVLTGGWDADLAARLIREYRPTWIYFWVPTMVRDLMQHPDWAQLPTNGLKTILCGEPVPAELQQTLIDHGIAAQNSYGMSETMPVGILKPIVAWGDTPPVGSCGRPVGDLCEVRLRDPLTGNEITEPETTGEVCVRGGVVSPGYYNDAERTAAAFDVDGYLHTRDMAYFDEDGWWYLGGRVDDIINSGGEKLSLVEVEDALRAYAGVLDVACVAVAHERFGEVPAAFVVMAEDAETSGSAVAKTLDEHCLANLERWKRPRLYLVIDAIPRVMPKRTKDLRALRSMVEDRRLTDSDGVIGASIDRPTTAPSA